MALIALLLMCFAFALLALAALPAGEPRRTQLVPLGLALWCFAVLLGYAGAYVR